MPQKAVSLSRLHRFSFFLYLTTQRLEVLPFVPLSYAARAACSVWHYDCALLLLFSVFFVLCRYSRVAAASCPETNRRHTCWGPRRLKELPKKRQKTYNKKRSRLKEKREHTSHTANPTKVSSERGVLKEVFYFNT